MNVRERARNAWDLIRESQKPHIVGVDFIYNAIKEAVAQEREECAKVAETWDRPDMWVCTHRQFIAKAIRGRVNHD